MRASSRLLAAVLAALLSVGAGACSEGEVDDAGVGPGAETGADLGDEELGDPATGEAGFGDPSDPDSELQGADG